MGSHDHPDRSRLAGVRVLVVEDDADIRRMIATVLATAGADVVEAASGADGKKALAVAAADAVILDWNLDDMPAAAFIDAAEAVRPGSRARTVVATGDLIRRGEQHEAERLGLTLLCKPFRPGELVDLIARLVAP